MCLSARKTLLSMASPEDMMPDAEDMGADKKIKIAPFSEIQKAMEDAKHVLFF